MNIIGTVDFDRDVSDKIFPFCETLYAVSFDGKNENTIYWRQNARCGCETCMQISQGQCWPVLIQTADDVFHNLLDEMSGQDEPCTDCEYCEWLRDMFHNKKSKHRMRHVTILEKYLDF